MNEDLDTLLGRFAGAMDAERGSAWTGGDIVNAALDTMLRDCGNPREYRRRRRALLGQFAQRAGCTITRVAQLAAVAGTFGTEQRHGERYAAVAWSYFRAVMNAATRTKQDARQLLDDALAAAMTTTDLNAMGKEIPQAVESHETCGECGAEQRVRVVGSMAHNYQGMALVCAVCCSRILQENNAEAYPFREAPRLGALG